MPDTWGRGLGEDGHNPKGAVDAAAARYEVEPSLWRAVCRESGLHGSGRGGWVRRRGRKNQAAEVAAALRWRCLNQCLTWTRKGEGTTA
jgi:hypothetical protein